MLSRVAESLYWMARYIERAEDLTRLLAVNFNALLDSKPADAKRGWEAVVGINGDDPLFTELHTEANAQSVSRFVFWEPLNSNSVVSCITRARENARGVREQISSEMWEAVNRLYFLVRDTKRANEFSNPIDFFELVRDRAQAYQGITSATMTHGEPYQFIRLGLHLERADKTARILEGKYHYLNLFSKSPAETSLQLIALLRSCAAFEPYRRASGGQLSAEKVVEYLLLDHEFPRGVLFCLNRCQRTLDAIGEDPTVPVRPDSPRRVLGRLNADLEYLDIHDVLGENMDPFLSKFLTRLNSIGDEIARTYFNTSVILPDERPRQQQQQQQ
ncbi:MAG: alpha-E domain-containing protein [Anaerolineales bacterium]|nr:alpha-E domain-containing protein [Anaerolineales bacterium]